MSDGKSILQKMEKSNELARLAAGIGANERSKIASLIDPLPRNTVSKALRDVLDSQSRISEVTRIASGLPNTQLQKAIDAAMGPSKAIKAAMDAMPSTALQKAMDAMPSTALQKAMQQMSTVSVPKMHSLPTVSRTPMQQTSREKRSDLHTLRNVAELGEAIRRTRKSKGLTQQSFADLAGVGRRFVSELEQGKQTLEIGKVLKVASAAGIQLMFNQAETNS